MPYIGRGPAKSGAFRILDDVSGSFNGSTVTFALTVASTALTVGLPETLIIAVDGVIQEPGSAYTISGSNIVFGSAPQDSATFWGVELGDVGGLADRATTQSASNDSTKVATTAYVDNQIDVQLTAEDLDITGDSGTIAIDLDSEVLAITGGTGITTTASGSAVNIVGHADAHTVASHSDTTGTGAELETLTDGSNAESLHTHTHTVVSHSDTTATGAELETLTDGSTTALHAHAGGGPTEASQANMQDEATGTLFAPPDLIKHSPGVAKAWVKFEQSGTHPITDDYNVTGVTDGGVGISTITFGTAMANTDYAMVACAGAVENIGMASQATTAVIINVNTLSASGVDSSKCAVAVFGDQ